MKSILISIKPKWVAKILSGEKTVEIRKTEPKCDLPIKVYIYCTKGKGIKKLFDFHFDFLPSVEEGKLFKDRHVDILNGKVVASFTLNYVQQINYDHNDDGEEWYWTRFLKKPELYEKSGLDFEQIDDYLNKKQIGCAWYIDDLEIFDEPKSIWQMKFYSKQKKVRKFGPYDVLESKQISKAPQSWCYVEEDE